MYNDFIWFMRDDTSNEIFAWFCIPFILSIIDTVIMQYYDSTMIEIKIKSYFPADINYIVYGINVYTINIWHIIPYDILHIVTYDTWHIITYDIP